jgi:hypothetical protein
MKFQKHDNEALDLIGKRLLAQDVMSPDEVDRIVANPYLFAKIRQRNARAVPTGSHLFIRYSAIFAGVAIFAFLTIASIGLFSGKQDVASIPEVRSPADVPAAVRPANLPPLMVGSNPSRGRTNYYRETEPERVAPRTAAYVAAKPKRYTETPQARPEFYPINYAGDAAEMSAGSHIVRVDIPRSRLFAMGVNVPLENDSDTVKADLLVGPDGITRAIRVLK